MNCRALHRVTQICGATIAVFGFALVANAQQAPEDTTPPPPSPPASEEQPPAEKLPPCPMPEQATPQPPPPLAPAPVVERRHNIIFAPREVTLTTGAGATNYLGNATHGSMDPGAGWDARLMFGTHSILALEAGYVGSTNNIDLTSGNHGLVSSNGVDGDFRVQLPYRVQPYIFSGLGYNHMAVTHKDSVPQQTGPVNNTDDQLTVPAGGGLAGYIGKHATLDLRGTYRYIPDNGITVMNSSALHQWVAQAHIGYVF